MNTVYEYVCQNEECNNPFLSSDRNRKYCSCACSAAQRERTARAQFAASCALAKGDAPRVLPKRVKKAKPAVQQAAIKLPPVVKLGLWGL